MKIYVNEQYEILALDNAPGQFFKEIEVIETREQLFGNLCDVCICGYCYEPAYERMVDEDGRQFNEQETDQICYKVDEYGNKIQNGWQCYPFMDYHTIIMTQKQHEASQVQIDDLTLVLADVIGGAYNA